MSFLYFFPRPVISECIFKRPFTPAWLCQPLRSFAISSARLAPLPVPKSSSRSRPRPSKAPSSKGDGGKAPRKWHKALEEAQLELEKLKAAVTASEGSTSSAPAQKPLERRAATGGLPFQEPTKEEELKNPSGDVSRDSPLHKPERPALSDLEESFKAEFARRLEERRKELLEQTKRELLVRKAPPNTEKPVRRTPPTTASISTRRTTSSRTKPSEGDVVELTDEEQKDIEEVFVRRKRLLVPFLWASAILAATFAALAFMGVKNPQLVIDYKGKASGWLQFDPLTIGIVAAIVAVQLSRRFPVSLWETFLHIPGHRHFTLLTYAFVHENWPALLINCGIIACFLPLVLRDYFDGDLFHGAAFLLSIPIIIGFVSHFPLRFISKAFEGVGTLMGASGAVNGLLGLYLASKWKEEIVEGWKVTRGRWFFLAWMIPDVLFLLRGSMVLSSFAHLTGLFVGSAYYYFDGKNKVWVPLRQLLEKERVVAEPIATDHSEALDSGKPIEPSKVTETPKVTESPKEPSKGKMAEEK